MSTSPVTPNPQTTPTTPPTTGGLPSSQSLNNMFLQLLVAQLQNQDPLDPQDPSQFVGQLAQFSELSEVTSIYQLLQQEAPSSTGASGSTSSGSSSSATNTPLNAANAATNMNGNTFSGAPLGLGSAPATAAPVPISFPNLSAPASAILSKIQGGF